jgi:hypothetical protein
MNKSILSAAVLLVIGVGVYFFLNINRSSEKGRVTEQPQAQEASFDGRNSTFTIEGRTIVLVNGVSEQSIEGSAANVTTRYFGNEANGDLNGVFGYPKHGRQRNVLLCSSGTPNPRRVQDY